MPLLAFTETIKSYMTRVFLPIPLAVLILTAVSRCIKIVFFMCHESHTTGAVKSTSIFTMLNGA